MLPLPLPMVEPPVRERTRTRGSVERTTQIFRKYMCILASSFQACSSAVAIPPECGISKVRALRITNGTPAKKNQWPWQVALGYTNPADNTIDYLCGGALVTKR